jgi:exoribonuclease R
VVGSEDDPRAASLIAIHSHGIPTGFSEEAEAEARHASRRPWKAATTCATCRS